MTVSIKANGISTVTKPDGIAIRWHGDKVADQLSPQQAKDIEAKLIALRMNEHYRFAGKVIGWSGVVQP